MWFLSLVSFWEVVTCILIFCGYCFWSAWFARVICPLMQEHSLRLKKLIDQSLEVKDQKTCLQENILIKLRATCWPKKRCKSNLCSRQWELASGSDAQRVLWNDSPKCLSTDSHPLPSLFSRFFSPFPQTESLFTGYHRPEACIPIFSMIFCLFFCFSINF